MLIAVLFSSLYGLPASAAGPLKFALQLLGVAFHLHFREINQKQCGKQSGEDPVGECLNGRFTAGTEPVGKTEQKRAPPKLHQQVPRAQAQGVTQ